MMNSVSQDGGARRRSRTSMVLLIVIFGGPLLVAWMILKFFPQWIPEGTVNNGDLVEPVRPLPEFTLQTTGGQAIDQTFLRGKWTIVYLASGDCGETCVEHLYNIRQIRLAQGKNVDRLQRLLLWDAAGVDAEQRRLLQETYPGHVIAPIDAAGSSELLQVFTLDEADALGAQRVYLVDPLGNLMMKYEPGEDPYGMIEDLERLLKYSGLG